jgi:N-acetyl-anhydromuramyl-L-alanine amidase AmpD
MRLSLKATAAAGVVLLVACSDDPTSPRIAEDPPTVTENLEAIFAEAGEEFDVPASLLKAIGYAETRWEMVRGFEEFPGMPAAFGIMALRGERLELGAARAGVSPSEARYEARANIRAAAALLSAHAAELDINRMDLAAWAPAVAEYSGIASPEGQAAYVHGDVYGVLKEGVVVRLTSGQVLASIMPVSVEPAFREPPDAPLFSDNTGYNLVWRPSPNYNSRPTGDIGKVHMVIIHTCEGSYTSCWSWLTNDDSNVSAHYVVKEDGSEISQLVREADRAWHIGSTYDCSLNSSHECWRNGYSNNHFTVGVEHGGFASQSSWPTAQINASADLVCHTTDRHAIPRDKYHILGHAQLQPYNRTDPGENWPWSTYYSKINSYCSSEIIVDSNNNNNDPNLAKMEVSANWTSSNATPGYYGTGYWWASTQAISDPAHFWFYLSAAATKTIDAWWTSGSNRSDSAPYLAYDASGTHLGTVRVNQQANGGKWNQLGSWSFSAGWNRISLSRWTTEGYVVIADAVRIR